MLSAEKASSLNVTDIVFISSPKITGRKIYQRFCMHVYLDIHLCIWAANGSYDWLAKEKKWTKIGLHSICPHRLHLWMTGLFIQKRRRAQTRVCLTILLVKFEQIFWTRGSCQDPGSISCSEKAWVSASELTGCISAQTSTSISSYEINEADMASHFNHTASRLNAVAGSLSVGSALKLCWANIIWHEAD